MNIRKKPWISRRTFLRGTGVALALPYLEAMMPQSLLAAPMPEAPSRMGMFYFGTGMNMRQFWPEQTGLDAKSSRILQPLEKHRGDFTAISGTYLAEGGGHDGAYPFSTSIAKGKKQQRSPDQIAAQAIGSDTRFASLQLSVDRGTNYGHQALATISWNEQGVPLAAENDPKVLFDKLFRPDTPDEKMQEKKEFRRRQSILDLVRDDAKQLASKLGQTDREQLEQYYHSVRELELSLAKRVEWADTPKPPIETDNLHGTYAKKMAGPEGNGDYLYDDYAKLMYDLIALAFQTDSTRVVSYVVRKELAGGVYPEFNVSQGYHSLSHHGNDPQSLEELARVDTIYMQHWAYLLDRLKSIREGDRTLLDRTLLGLSSGMGFEHSKNNLPTILSGGGDLGVEHHGHLKLEQEAPLASLWHTMLDRVGVPVDGPFQDSSGTIAPLVS
ncbi:DUF1552 domain-containing protein [Blastopirellula marina]|uniref:DUF1552 domain-containing protein n=1 Tax=Blastopirellula marina TaxID=124 RepID=A0A2S8G0W5_9BACT|nr:DUF1552 domain-containing protein [Blastopirellula marina]PQO38088.1 hypothetical protein C5Y98_08365 [Blastopirellula marina]PTL44744.1 DUF1552 domain-containing protein [Blastopirellula marina]